MIERVEAIYESGVLRPMRALSLAESQRVHTIISDLPREPAATPRTGFAKIDLEFLAQCQAEVAAMEYVPTLEEVHRIMSKIPDSMSDAIVAERDETG